MLSESETESKQKIRRNKVQFHCLFAFRWIHNTKTLNTQFKILNTQLSQKEVGKYPFVSNPYLELWQISRAKKIFSCILGRQLYRILGGCILISSLPGKALKTIVELQGLPSDSTCVLEAEPGKLDIKRCEPGIQFISLQVVYMFSSSNKGLT